LLNRLKTTGNGSMARKPFTSVSQSAGRCHAFMVVRARSRKTQGVKIRREDGLTSGV
jgi:hypothetical protein